MFEQAFCRGDGRRMFAKHLIVGLGMLAALASAAPPPEERSEVIAPPGPFLGSGSL